jgi:hypothetical protein
MILDLIERVQAFVADKLQDRGFERLSWDVATFSLFARHTCIGCARRSFTERTHITHVCTTPRSAHE